MSLYEVYSTLQVLDSIPNVVSDVITKTVGNKLQGYASLRTNNLNYAEDKSAIYAHIPSRIDNTASLIFISHLDHPGYLTDNALSWFGSNCAKPKGPTFYYTSAEEKTKLGYSYPRVDREDETNAIFYDTESETWYCERARYYSANNNALYFSHIPPGRNYQVVPILRSESTEEVLGMRSANNHIANAVLLDLIKIFAKEQNIFPNLTFIFCKNANDNFASANEIAQRKETPFNSINNNSLLIGPGLVDLNEVGFHDIDSPIILSGSSREIYGSKEKENKSISILRKVLLAQGLPSTPRISHTGYNLNPFNNFGLSTNIAGLVIPCRNFHNVNRNIGFYQEIVMRRHIDQMYSILLNLIKDFEVLS